MFKWKDSYEQIFHPFQNLNDFFKNAKLSGGGRLAQEPKERHSWVWKVVETTYVVGTGLLLCAILNLIVGSIIIYYLFYMK